MLACLAVLRVRQVVLPRVECVQRVGSRMVQVEVTNHQGRERVILEQNRRGDSAKRSRLEREIVGVDDLESGELELKKALWGKYVD